MISDDVRRFVLTSIPSIPHLEAALLFHAAPDVARSAGDVAHALYLPEGKVVGLLDSLCAAGILAPESAPDKRYRYAPCDAPLAAAIEALAKAYSADMIGVTHLIHNSTEKNALRFADAFKLRKDR